MTVVIQGPVETGGAFSIDSIINAAGIDQAVYAPDMLTKPLGDIMPRVDLEAEDRTLRSREYVLSRAIELLQVTGERIGESGPRPEQLRALSVLAGRTDDPVHISELGFDRWYNMRQENLPRPVLAIPIASNDPDKISYFLQLLVTGIATGTNVQAYAGQHVRKDPRVVGTLKKLGLAEEQVFVGGRNLVDATTTQEYLDLTSEIAAHKAANISPDPYTEDEPKAREALEESLSSYLYQSQVEELFTLDAELRVHKKAFELAEKHSEALIAAGTKDSSEIHAARQQYELAKTRLSVTQANYGRLLKLANYSRDAFIESLETQRTALLYKEDQKLAQIVGELSDNPNVHAILPMLRGNTEAGDAEIRAALTNGAKDIDGINPALSEHFPITPVSMIELAEHFIGMPLEEIPAGEIAAAGNGMLVGEPLRKILEQRGIVLDPQLDMRKAPEVKQFHERIEGKPVTVVFAMARTGKLIDVTKITPGSLGFTFIIDAGNDRVYDSRTEQWYSFGNVIPESLSADHAVWATPLIGGLGPATALNAIKLTQETAWKQHFDGETFLKSRRLARVARRAGDIAMRLGGHERPEVVDERRHQNAQKATKRILRNEVALVA